MKNLLRFLTTTALLLVFTTTQGWGQMPVAGWDMSDQTAYGGSEASRDALTYTWIGADNASWAVPGNWNPARSTPVNDDILQFSDGSTKTVTSVLAQTIGKLLVTDNTNVTFQAVTAATLTISNDTGVDLEVAAGSQLNVSGAAALSISLATGATGSVSGAMTFAGGAHKLLAADAAVVTFNNGAVFTAGVDFDGYAFGNTNLNSAIFASGSTYIYKSGLNPFSATTPKSVVEFQSGSLYLHKSSTRPSFSGRTYANFEYDNPNPAGSANAIGSKSVSIDNLKITQGIFGFDVTAIPGHSIKGNIEIMTGATLNFSPTSAGTVNLNGTSLQTISGGGTLSAGSNSTLVIDNTSGVRLNGSATFNHLTIVSGSSFDIFTTGACTVVGTLTNNAGAANLIIHSDATSTGSLIHSTANVPATVENYFTGTSLSWHLLSSPVESQAISGDFTPVASAYDFYLWYEQADTWVNFKNTSVAPTWNTANGSNNFEVGRGYLAAYESTNPTKSFIGNLNQGAVTEVLTVSGSGIYKTFNLVGNPYPSTIDWKASSGWNWTNLEGNAGGGYDMHIYNDADGNYGTYNSASLSNAGSNGVTRYITSCQGFMVKAATAGDIGMDNGIRVTNSQAFLKSTEELQDYLVLKVTNPEQSYADETIIEFHHENDEGGASKLFSFVEEAPSLYTSKYGENYAINFYSQPNNERFVPLNFEAGVNGDYVITANSLETFAQGTVIIMEDMKANITQELTDNSVYEFQANINDDPARFKLHFAGSFAIHETAHEDFNIYSSGSTIYINSSKNKNSFVNIYNTTGQLLVSKQLNVNGLTQIELNTQTGWYIVNVLTVEGSFVRKVFIN